MTADRSPGEWNLAVRQQAAVAHLGQLGLRVRDLDELLSEAMVAVADTLGLSFFGFLASRLPRFLSLDMVFPFAKRSARRMPTGSMLRGVSEGRARGPGR